ncbi:hypothetical protein [Luteibaculum oceani]|uniref:Uncharacterized protein n=1 Tax=Luteibaculum oceani TaxID=1294296 RepID=A0A5C6VIM7_9FLAO|nr:hypothetical protein [Luteibaculum oceani]TXC85253.1 hypothetical protein FRX97_01115 [Luteibaculum oceani]
MFKKVLFPLIFLLLITPILAQAAPKYPDKNKLRKELKIAGLKKVLQLKEGILIFRFQTKKLAIESLERKGRVEAATKLRQEVSTRNKFIVERFKRNFNFCEVHFIYSHQSNIVRKDYSQAQFIDMSFNPTQAPKGGQFFLTADFSEANTFDEINELTPPGVILRDQNFQQIKRPIKAHSFTVEKFNRRLKRMYRKAKRKQRKGKL